MNLYEMTDHDLSAILSPLTANLDPATCLFPIIDEKELSKTKERVSIIKSLLNTEDMNEKILLDIYSPVNARIIETLSQYAMHNPYKTYQCRDEYLDDQPDLIQKLFDSESEDDIRGWYYDLVSRVEGSYRDCDYDYEKDYWKEAWDKVIQGEADFPDVPVREELSGEAVRILVDLLRENDVYMYFDCDEHVRGILSSTSVMVRAVPLTSSNRKIYSPHFEGCSSENQEEGEYLNRVFKMATDQTKSENWSDATYSGSYMCFMGDIDLVEIIDNWRLPNTLTIFPGDRYVFFNGGNGSGSGFEPEITRAVKLRCRFLVDNAKDNRYGVDDTYGFSYSVWRDELGASYEVWDAGVEAFYLPKGKTDGWRKLKVK